MFWKEPLKVNNCTHPTSNRYFPPAVNIVRHHASSFEIYFKRKIGPKTSALVRGHLRVRVASVLIATLTLILGVVLGADLLVVELKCGKILASFRELALLHSLANKPSEESIEQRNHAVSQIILAHEPSDVNHNS